MLEARDSTEVVRPSDERSLGAYVIQVKRAASRPPGVLGHPETRLTVKVRDSTQLRNVLTWLWSLGLDVEAIKKMSSTDAP